MAPLSQKRSTILQVTNFRQRVGYCKSLNRHRIGRTNNSVTEKLDTTNFRRQNTNPRESVKKALTVRDKIGTPISDVNLEQNCPT